MKKIILTIFSLAVFSMIHSQESWTIGFAKKTILKKVAENQQKNSFTLTKSSLKNSSKLTIQLHGVDTANLVTLMANQENGNNVKEWEYAGKVFTISGNELKSLFNTNNKLLFYYRSIPKDPNLAAVVRIRPVHVCTILLK